MKRRLLAIVLAGVLVFSQNGAVLAAENSAADGTAAEVTVEEPDQAQEEIEEQDAEPEDPAPEEEEEISVQPQENTEDPAPETEENTEDPAPETEEGKEEVSADAKQENAAGTEVVETEPEAAAEEAAEEEIVIEGEVPAQEAVSDAAYGLEELDLVIYPWEFHPDTWIADRKEFTPYAGYYDENGEFVEIQNPVIECDWEYDEDCVSIWKNADGSYSLTRISDLETDFTLHATVIKDGEEWSGDQHYHFNDRNCHIEIKDYNENPLFDDSTGDYIWKCSVDAEIEEDYILTLEAEGPNGEDASEACWIDQNFSNLYIDGAQLKELGISRVKVRIGAKVKGYPLSVFGEREIDVRESFVEDQFDFYDRSLLPGWDQWISTRQRVYIENSIYPNGIHFERTVTNVEVEDEEGQDVVIIESQEYDGWRLRAQNMGVSKVTVTYTDWDETEGKTEVFYLYVGGEVYDVDVWTDSGSKMVLKGGTVPMSAQASLETYDAANDHYYTASEEELADITYDWSLWIHQDNAREELGDVITVTPDAADPRKAVVSFEGVPEEWDEGIDVNVTVTISDEGEEVAENNYWLRMDNQYLELWPTRIDGDLGVGESFTLTPELREYPGENGEEYNILTGDQVEFEPEIYDYDAYEVEDNGDGTFTVTRRRNYDCSFRIVAYYEYNRVADREYWFNRKDYNFHYDIDGSDKIYSDGSRTFGFDLSELGGIEFELVPEVGQGYYDEYGGFDYNIPEGYGWSYNSTTHEITFDGEELYDRGYEYIDTRISLRIGGEEVNDEWRHFDIRQPRFDIWDEIDERPLFIGEDRIISKQGGAFIENNAFPDGTETTYTITELTFNPDESEEDPRDPITVTDEGDHWRLEAVRNGMVEVHAVYEVSTGAGRSVQTITEERDYMLFVSGWRYDFNLRTSTGSDKLLTGGEITLFPEIYGEGYDWQTGERYNIDTSDYEVIYYVECTHVDDDLLEREYDWDFDAASARGELWDYTENPQDRSITITAENFDGAIDIWVSAELYDPESGDSYAYADRTIYVDPMTFALELYEEDEETELEWNEQLPPGGEITFVPGIVRAKTGTEPAPIGNPDDVVYTMEWHAGSGEWDPGHFYVEKANGEELHPGEQVTAQDAPFTIRKTVAWDASLFIRAEWEDEEDNRQEAWRDFKIYEQEYSKGFIANNDRGDDHFTWYYNDEEVSIRPDREKLDALQNQGYAVETTVEIGIWDRENAEMTPIPQYDPVAAGVFDEQNGLHAQGTALKDLREHLAAAIEEGEVPRVFLRIHSELNDVIICDEIFQVALVKPFVEIVGLGSTIPLGKDMFFDDGEVQLYVEDSLNDTGVNAYYETGTFYDIAITDISVGAEDQQYLSAERSGTRWTIQALQLADHAIPVTVTFTGGPQGYSPLTVEIEIVDTVFWAELMTSGGENAEHIKILMGETEQLQAEVTRVFFEAGDLPTESVLPDEEGYHYEIRYEHYNRDVVDIDKNTGTITPLKTGTTEYSFLIAIYDKDGNEVDGQWRDGVIEVSAFFAEIEVPEGAVYEVVPGKDYTAQEIYKGLGAQFKLYSMRHPEGVTLTANEFFIDRILDETEGVSLKEESWGGYEKLSVDTSAQPGSFGIVLQVEDDSYSYRTGKPVNIEIIDPHSHGSWQHNSSGYWYRWPDGTYPKNGFETIFGDTYYFNASGYRVTSWQKIGGKWYYFDDSGKMLTGWQDISGTRYYFDENGVMQTGWKKIDGDWYYFSGGGAMVKDWQKIGDKWYYFDNEGWMLTGFQEINNKEYYFAASGAMQTGWQKIDGDWYYFAGSGAMAKDWQKIGDKWYYFGDEGWMQTGLQQIGQNKYYFAAGGAMQTGWQKIDGYWYYFSGSGAMTRGWMQSGKIWYYFDDEGRMQTGLQTINNKKYYFAAGGAMQTGWQKAGDDWYYFEAGGAAACSKWIGNYYMTESGVMAVNQWVDNHKYYVGSDGRWIPGYTETISVN